MQRKFFQREGIILLLCLALGIVATFPLVFKMNSHVYGYPGDPLGVIHSFWWGEYARANNLDMGYTDFRSAPEGYKVNVRGQGPFILFSGLFLTRLKGEIFAYNFLLFFSFPLSAFTMYLLVNYFTREKLGSFLAGIIYALCPYHFAHSFQHLTSATIQWIPLYLLFLFKLRKEKNYKNALICGFLFALITLDFYYYGYFMIFPTLLFLFFPKRRLFLDGVKQVSPRKNFMLTLAAGLMTLAVILPWLYPVLKGIITTSDKVIAASHGYIRPLKDLFYYSAKPLSYFLPSSYHPVLGKITQGFLGTIFYGSSPTEHTLYLGYVPLALAVVAVRVWKRQKNSSERDIRISGVGYFIALAALALIFSQSPYWRVAGIKVFFPSYFLYKIFPMFRVYARFGLIVMLAVSVLAGMGTKIILSRIRSQGKRIAIFSLLIFLVLFDFLPFPPYHLINAGNIPPAYEWLAKQPGDFIIAEYPLVMSQDILFYQRIHQKKLVNGAKLGTSSWEIRKTILDISSPEVPGILAGLGTKYVIVHLDKYLLEEEAVKIIGEIPDVNQQTGLKLVEKFKDTEIYKVIARPLNAKEN